MFDLLKKCLKDIEPLILIERLRLYLKPNNEFETLLALQSSRLTALKNQQNLRTITQEIFATERNKVIKTLSEFIDELIEGDFKANDKDFLTITEENIQDTVEFIQGHIEDLECSFSFTEYIGGGLRVLEEVLMGGSKKNIVEKDNSYYTFQYSKGVGIIEYKEETERKHHFPRGSCINYFQIEILFKDLRLLELENYKNERVYGSPLHSSDHLKQICFYARNRKKAIKVVRTEVINDIQSKVVEDNYEEYRLTVINENITQRIVNAFKFLMKANGAKEEMF
jgi:hypothetical protein